MDWGSFFGGAAKQGNIDTELDLRRQEIAKRDEQFQQTHGLAKAAETRQQAEYERANNARMKSSQYMGEELGYLQDIPTLREQLANPKATLADKSNAAIAAYRKFNDGFDLHPDMQNGTSNFLVKGKDGSVVGRLTPEQLIERSNTVLNDPKAMYQHTQQAMQRAYMKMAADPDIGESAARQLMTIMDHQFTNQLKEREIGTKEEANRINDDYRKGLTQYNQDHLAAQVKHWGALEANGRAAAGRDGVHVTPEQQKMLSDLNTQYYATDDPKAQAGIARKLQVLQNEIAIANKRFPALGGLAKEPKPAGGSWLTILDPAIQKQYWEAPPEVQRQMQTQYGAGPNFGNIPPAGSAGAPTAPRNQNPSAGIQRYVETDPEVVKARNALKSVIRSGNTARIEAARNALNLAKQDAAARIAPAWSN